VNKETIIMGNSALAEELVGTKEIDELHKLDASESDPEDGVSDVQARMR
jgi:hypothetical protein